MGTLKFSLLQNAVSTVNYTFNLLVLNISNELVGIGHYESGSSTGSSIDTFVAGIAYDKGQVIIYNNYLYKCLVSHTSASTMALDASNWQIGDNVPDWASSISYNEDDLIVYSGNVYRCNTNHTSSSVFNTGYFELVNYLFMPDVWAVSTLYDAYDLVIYEGILLQANDLHTSDSIDIAIDLVNGHWEVEYSTVDAWSSSTSYAVGDLISYNNRIYRCTVAHISASSFDFTKWALLIILDNSRTRATQTPKLELLLIQEDWKFADDSFNLVIRDMDNKLLGVSHADSNVHWSGWQTGYAYQKGDVVRTESCKSNQYYYCVTNGISGVTEPTNNVTGSIVTDGTAEWKVCIIGDSEGNASVDIFRGGASYNKGQLVLYNDVLYRCMISHVAAATMELDENYWQQVDASLQPWKASTYFFVDDIVVYDNVIYKCKTAHTSGYSFDDTKWQPLNITVINDWETNKKYLQNQIVLYEGILYRALDAHTSDSTDFGNDVGTHWEYVCAELPEWGASISYVAGQVVIYNNRLYKCNTAHTSTSTFDQTKWEAIVSAPVIEEWQSDTNYLENQVVKYYDMLLIAIDTHTSDSIDIINDMDSVAGNVHWKLLYANIEPWQANTVYEIGSQVIYDNNLYQCKNTHTSGIAFADANWELIGQADAFIYEWQANKYYKQNQVVVHDKEIWVNNTTHTSASTWGADEINWTKISSETIVDNWASSTQYLENQFVIYNGVLYRCTTGHTSTSTFDDTKFEFVNASIVDWQASTEYIVGNLVVYNNQLYKCLTAHTSSSDFEIDATNWTPVANNIAGIPAWVSGVYYYPNQVVKYDGKIWRCLVAHKSVINDEQPDTRLVYSDSTQFFYVNESTSLPASTTIDLGSTYVISDVSVTTGGAYITITGVLEGSVDNTNFSQICTFSGRETQPGASIGVNSLTNVRYLRFTVNTRTFPGGITFGSVKFSNLNVWADSDKWEVIVYDNIRLTYWKPNVRYNAGDIVLYNDDFYKCIESNNSGSSFDNSKWKKIPDLVITYWQPNTLYKVNQLVMYDGKMYKCELTHTSSSTFTQYNWTPINDTVDDWTIGKYYYEYQVVKYNNSLWRCLSQHLSATETPEDNEVYTASGNTVDVNDTTTIPYNEVIDLSAVYKIQKLDYTEVATNMSMKYYIEMSIDGIAYTDYEDDNDVRYIRITVYDVDIPTGAVSPQAYLDNFKVYVYSDKWEEVSTMNTLTDIEIDEMFE